MSGPENTFIASTHKHLPPDLYRIKNHNVYNAGQADCWYSGTRADLWVEYKFIVVPKLDASEIDICGGKKPDLSHLQQEWLRGRHREGRQVGVIIGCKEGGVWLPGVKWECSFSALVFRKKILNRAQLAQTILKLVS